MMPELPELGVPTSATEHLPDFGPAAPADRMVTVEVNGSDPKKANESALAALMDGANSVLFWVHQSADVALLVRGIDSSIAPLHLVGDLDPDAVAAQLESASQGLYNADPLEQKARGGTWFTGSWASDLDRLRRAEASLPPAMGAIVSNACFAGPGAVAQLAWGLASLEAMNPAPGRPVGLVLQATADYFETAAMAQAARLLWTQNPLWIVGRAGGGGPSDDAADLADTALAAQALALGGCRDLCIAPINESAQAARWARHQGLVLYYETGLLEQDYPLRGSYLLEQWTAELAEAARKQTAEWNRRGGLVELLNRNENLWN